MNATRTTETRCLYCGATMTWTEIFIANAPKGYPFFDCGRHAKYKRESAACGCDALGPCPAHRPTEPQ